jgi:acyl-CoA thioesterase YciA
MAEIEPTGQPTIRAVAMPHDLNPSGDVFGGWLVSQMDIAGGVAAGLRAEGRVATVAIDAMHFHKPMKLGDLVSCYCELEKVGRTSLAYRIEAWARRRSGGPGEKITEGRFTYVAIGPDGRPRPVPPEGSTGR